MQASFNPVVGSFIYNPGTSWRFRLSEPLLVKLDWWLGEHVFEDETGRPWLTIDGNMLKVHEGYAWDGSSPKFSVGNYWVGTPDYENSRAGSCVHDACYQFLHLPCFPLKRLEVDELFREIMASRGFKLAWIYATAVKVFGPPFYWLGTAQGRRVGRCRTASEIQACQTDSW